MWANRRGMLIAIQTCPTNGVTVYGRVRGTLSMGSLSNLNWTVVIVFDSSIHSIIRTRTGSRDNFVRAHTRRINYGDKDDEQSRDIVDEFGMSSNFLSVCCVHTSILSFSVLSFYRVAISRTSFLCT